MTDCYNTDCPICLKKPSPEDIIIKTPCKHFICLSCLEIGGYALRKCPVCRQELMEAYGYKYNSNERIFILNDKNCPCPNCFKKNKSK